MGLNTLVNNAVILNCLPSDQIGFSSVRFAFLRRSFEPPTVQAHNLEVKVRIPPAEQLLCFGLSRLEKGLNGANIGSESPTDRLDFMGIEPTLEIAVAMAWRAT